MSLSNLVMSLFTGVIVVSLLFHYPVGIGLIKACSVKTKRQCIMAGNHPAFLDDIAEQFHTGGTPSSSPPVTPLADMSAQQPTFKKTDASRVDPMATVYETVPGTPKQETSRF